MKNDLKNRGVKDVFIACVDGLKGFPEAIEAAFPQALVQLCMVHIGRYDCPKNHARTMVSTNTVPSEEAAEEEDNGREIYRNPREVLLKSSRSVDVDVSIAEVRD